jgi:hypothetical protein
LSSAFLSSSFASVSFGRCRCFSGCHSRKESAVTLASWLSFRSAAEESAFAFAFAFAFVFALVLAFVVVF